MESELTRLGAAEVHGGAELLAASFADDPLAGYLFPGGRRRVRLLRSIFLRAIRDAVPFGAVHAVRNGSELAGVGVSLPPGAFPPPTARSLRLAATLPLAAVLYPTSLGRIKRVLAADAAAHAQAPHWYIQAIGVRATHRRGGIGTQLLEAVLAAADRDRALTFLVTSNERNLDWYRRYRFAVVEETRVLPDAPAFWAMARQPAPTRAPQK